MENQKLPIHLRDVMESDLDAFFNHQQDKEAQHMAAFTPKEPHNRVAFDNHWQSIMNNPEIVIQTILLETEVIGHIAKFVMDGQAEVTYWIGKSYWGRGIASEALKLFLEKIKRRPLFARAAKDNIASIRVLEKCGFQVTGYARGFANARGKEIEEIIMKLS